VADRQGAELFASAIEEAITADHEPAGSQLGQSCEGRINLAFGARMRNLALPGTIFGAPEIVPGINIKETISSVKFGINYRFGSY
jgi:hypothetical protein